MAATMSIFDGLSLFINYNVHKSVYNKKGLRESNKRCHKYNHITNNYNCGSWCTERMFECNNLLQHACLGLEMHCQQYSIKILDL